MAIDFGGAKLMLFLGPDLLVIQRDDVPHIPWPGHLDFPGGGREGSETPEACALRETREEVGLVLTEAQLVWKARYQRNESYSYFFAAHLPAKAQQDVVFGDEGAGWMTMPPSAYLTAPTAIPHFQDRLRDYLHHLEQAKSGQIKR